MTTNEILTVIALVIGPLLAVQLTRLLDGQKEVRFRKLWIFRTLMSTRAARLSQSHVEALNLIDIEFASGGASDTNVREAWVRYLDRLTPDQLSDELFLDRSLEAYIDLLHVMSRALGYKLERTHIKNSSYYPKFHSEQDADVATIRRQLRQILDGSSSLRMTVTNFPDQLTRG